MGSMCSGAPVSASAGEMAATIKPSSIAISTKTPTSGPTDDGEGWKLLALEDEVLVKSVHTHILKKFKSKDDDLAGAAAKGEKVIKSAGEKPLGEGEGDDYYDEEDDGKWYCNGGEPNQGFEGGCKSGQTDFDFHIGTEGW